MTIRTAMSNLPMARLAFLLGLAGFAALYVCSIIKGLEPTLLGPDRSFLLARNSAAI